MSGKDLGHCKSHFMTSTHYKYWVLSEAAIRKSRHEAVAKAQYRMERFLHYSDGKSSQNEAPIEQTPGGIKRSYNESLRSGITPMIHNMNVHERMPEPNGMPAIPEQLYNVLQRTPNINNILAHPGDSETLTIEENCDLVNYYEYWARRKLNKHLLPEPASEADLKRNERLRPYVEDVVQTTVMFIKRFFLSESVVDFKPDLIAATCFYIASKTDAFRAIVFPGLERKDIAANVATIFQQTGPDIIAMESFVLSGLKCHLSVYHPLKLALRVLLRLRSSESAFFAPLRQASPAVYDATRERVSKLTELTQHCDCTLLFTPGVISFMLVVESLLLEMPETYTNRKELTARTLEALGQAPSIQQNVLGAAIAILDASGRKRGLSTPIDVESLAGLPMKARRLRILREKLKRCQNPLKIPGSDEHEEVKRQLMSHQENVQRASMASQDEIRRREASQLLGVTDQTIDEDDTTFEIKRVTQ
ncbi:Cyclin H-like [Carpediemonas membranifera]|uniref:Cyclin H-like n=1 Tax=Carpediemonas membranifera TaxID=201153 RepID=A0A8J6E500_9EUKA|nr:Cyclin H-like [Carpediemonas membranifera]|eukprot:KAG9397571.1 Cyclin H-like [Carpediemonas membranifera]